MVKLRKSNIYTRLISFSISFIALFLFAQPSFANSSFTTIPIDQNSTERIQNLYQNFPTGDIEFNSIPFTIPNEDKNFLITQALQSPDNPILVNFQTDIDNTIKVHLLINSGNTYTEYLDQVLGKIKFDFNDGSSFEKNLVIGQNIREWLHVFPNLVSTVTDSNSVEIWRSEGPAVIDLYSISLPAEYQNKKLINIEIHDQSQGILVPTDPGILLFAITVESEGSDIQKKSPILFIPGMFGSWNQLGLLHGADVPQSAWKKAAFVNDYDGLIQTIESAGYSGDSQSDDQSLFVFYYDWRKPVDTLADQLKAYIDGTIQTKHPDSKVKIVGHSLGGLVGRAYTQKYGSEDVDQLVTVGTPHKGAVDAYYIYEGGETGPNSDIPTRISVGLYLKANRWLFETSQKVIERTAPSFKDIFPLFNFLKDQKTGSIQPIATMAVKNTWLQSIDPTISTIYPLFDAIGGKSIQTKEWIKIKKQSALEQLLGKWKDGKPTGFDLSSNGDDSVLTKSSVLPVDTNTQLNLSHRDLVRTEQGINSILDIASISASTISSSTPPSLPVLVFSILSPAYIRITGPGILEESDELVVIPSAPGGVYKVEIIGTSTGSYRLVSGVLTSTDVWNEFQGNTKNGEVDTFTFTFNPTTGTFIQTGDVDALDYLLAIKFKLSSLNNQYSNNPLKLSLGFIDSSIDKYNKQSYKKIPPKFTPIIAELFAFRGKNNFNTEVITRTNEILTDLAWAEEYIGRKNSTTPKVNTNDLNAKKKVLSQLEIKLENDMKKGKASQIQALRLDYMRTIIEETEHSIHNKFLHRANHQLFQLNFYISEANSQ